MKHNQTNFIPVFTFSIALLFALGIHLISPSSLTAQQDIDDVINTLDRDFSLGSSKEEIRQENKERATEQNREDIKIVESGVDLNGKYVGSMGDSCTITVSGNTISADCMDESGSIIKVMGTISNLAFTFTYTITETGPPCTSSGTGNGSFQGSGEAGTVLTGFASPNACDMDPLGGNFQLVKV